MGAFCLSCYMPVYDAWLIRQSVGKSSEVFLAKVDTVRGDYEASKSNTVLGEYDFVRVQCYSFLASDTPERSFVYVVSQSRVSSVECHLHFQRVTACTHTLRQYIWGTVLQWYLAIVLWMVLGVFSNRYAMVPITGIKNGLFRPMWHRTSHWPRGYKTWVTRVRKQPIIALYFESENELKFYSL